MVMAIDYTKEDIEWIEQLLSVVTDDGCWMCPCSKTVFQFNKPKKEFSIKVGSDSDAVNMITVAILVNELGYSRVLAFGDKPTKDVRNDS